MAVEKKYKKVIAFVDKLFDKLQDHMLLKEWNFTLRFVAQDGSSIAGINDCSGPYLQSVITFDVGILDRAYREKNGNFITMVIAHELAHCLTQPSWDYMRDLASEREKPFVDSLNETLTQRIANCIMRGLDPEVYKIK